MLLLGLIGDRYLSRPDRIRLAEEEEKLTGVRNAILAYRLATTTFPENLSELVPDYVSQDMTTFQADARTDAPAQILWRPETGVLSWGDPFIVRGLIARARTLEVEIPALPVVRDALSGQNVFRQTPEQTTLSENDIVVEAEFFQFLTYGWEIAEDEDASGHCYIHMKEGAGDINHGKLVDGWYEWDTEFDPKLRSGDFYNIGGDRRRMEAHCYFMAPRAGLYFLALRTMAGPGHCSRGAGVRINDSGVRPVPGGIPLGGRPFTWLWLKVGKVRLDKGLNSIRFVTCQDDVKIDQALLTTKDLALTKDTLITFNGGYRRRPLLPHDVPPVNLSFRASTLTVTAENDPAVWIYLHKNVPQAVDAQLHISLDLPGGGKRETSHDIRLTAQDELTRFPCQIDLTRPLERKEYLLRCRLQVDSRVLQERTLVLSCGYDWSLLGPLPFMEVTQEGELEKDLLLKNSYSFNGQSFGWRKYSHVFSDHFRIMDFGRMFTGSTYHPMTNVSLYAYTEVEARADGPYLLKTQGDDNLVVWVNGQSVVTIAEKGPAIRTARDTGIRLAAGRNRILFRLNQKKGQWQAGIRIRTPDDRIADVRGVPYAQQEGITKFRTEP